MKKSLLIASLLALALAGCQKKEEAKPAEAPKAEAPAAAPAAPAPETKTQQRQRPKTKMQPHLLLRLLSLQRSNQYPGFILSLTLGMSGQAGQTPAFLLSALYDLPVEAIILLGDD